MTNKEYREHEGISKSSLFKITKSPMHFKWAMENPQEDTPSLLFGRCVHKYILEPETFFNEVAIIPTCDKRTKEGKAIYEKFLVVSSGKDVISQTDFEIIKEMAEVIRGNKFADLLLTGQHEESFFWTDEETGEACKCRPDCLCEIKGRHIIVDYKTTEDAETSAFMKSAIKYGYDLQAGMYIEGMKHNTDIEDYMFVFVAQEKKPPYAINIVECTPDFITEGTQLFHDLMAIYHECKEKDDWYGYMQNGINKLELPDWLKREVTEKEGE